MSTCQTNKIVTAQCYDGLQKRQRGFFSYGEDDKRVFRIDSIIKEEGTHVLRHCLANQLGGQALTSVLSQPSIRAKIDTAKKRKIIKRTQYDLLYPGGGAVDPNTFDVTLLTFLLRELHPKMKSASEVWTHPIPGDFSVEADVTRLRELRNKFGHEGSSKLSENEFSAFFVELRDVICRLARSSGYMDFSAMFDRLEQKKVVPFERKPAVTDQSTSITSSLERNIAKVGEKISIEKPELHVNRAISNNYIVLECSSNQNSLPKCRKNAHTSTSDLKTTIPQVTTVENYFPTNQSPKRSEAKFKHKIVQNLFSCFSANTIFREHSNVKTSQHSDLSSDRCQIEGIDCDMHNNLFIADCVHNSVQVFDANGRCTDEYECPQPSGVCMFSDSVVVVSHRNDSFVELLKFNRQNGKLSFQERVNIKCDLLHYEVKCNEMFVFVLCENSSVHYFNMSKKNQIEDIRSIEINEKVRSFDCFQDYTYLSTKYTIFCLDPLRRLFWRYNPARSDGPDMLSFEGLTIMNKRIYIAQPLKHSILEMSLNGHVIAEIVEDSLECPFRLTSTGSSLWVSQFSPYLNHDACRTIVQLKK